MSYSDENTFEKILDKMLSDELLANVDKRVGSIAYDSLAPVAMALADAYQALDIFEAQTYLMSATGTNLDRRVYDYGIARVAATYSERIGSFKSLTKTARKSLLKWTFQRVHALHFQTTAQQRTFMQARKTATIF